jgi:outer membrane protein assembly factor BamB
MDKRHAAVHSGWGETVALVMLLVMLIALAGLASSACSDGSNPASSSPSPSVSAGATSAPTASDLLLWKFKTGGSSLTSPVVADGVVLVGSSDGYLHAVDARSGQESWKSPAGDPAGSSPVVADGTIYIASNDGYLHALDLKSGEERWTFKVRESSAYAHSPAASGRAVYIVGNDGRLCALDGRTGRRIWAVKTGGAGMAPAPTAWGRTVYLGGGRGLEAYDAATGKKLWTYRPWGQGVYPDLVASDGMVYGRTGGFIQAVWAVDAQKGQRGWSLPSDWPASSPPAVAGGVAYFTSSDDDRLLRAVDARSGKDVWASRTGWVDSRLAASDGVVCVVCGNKLFAVDARTGNERWRFETGGWITGSPAVSAGVVYVASDDGYLYAVGSRPAVSYAEPPEPPAKAVTIGTVGWEFTPAVDVEVTELGCYDADRDGLAYSHRVGVFDAKSERLLGSVTVRPASALEGAFRWESLEAPVILRAGRAYVVGTQDRMRDTVGTHVQETLYAGDAWPPAQWAPEIAFNGLRTSHGRSNGAFVAPTDDRKAWAMITITWMSPDFKFVPVPSAPSAP